MNNSTAIAIATETPRHDKNDALNIGVPRPSGGWQLTPVPRQKPTISQLAAVMDSFGIRGTTRLVSYELLSFWTPGSCLSESLDHRGPDWEVGTGRAAAAGSP